MGDHRAATRLVGEYFWQTEHTIVGVWLVAVACALIAFFARRSPARLILWLGGLFACYGTLFAISDELDIMSVCGRHVRPLAIFACLISAWALAKLNSLSWPGRFASGLAAVAILYQAAINFHQPWTQLFPDTFNQAAAKAIGEAVSDDKGPYRLVNNFFYHNTDYPDARPDLGVRIFQRPHPLDFQPYLYEGYSLEQRIAFRKQDLSMRVIRLVGDGTLAGPRVIRSANPFGAYSGSSYPKTESSHQ